MTTREKMMALKAALLDGDSPVPSTVLSDVFSDWSRGNTDEDELVAHLLPLRGQPPLLRLQILAQAINLGQTLLKEAENRLLRETELAQEHLGVLDEMEHDGVSEATQTAIHLHLDALSALDEALESFEPEGLIQSLELGQEAATTLRYAFSLLPAE